MNKMMFLVVCFAALFFACSESPHWAGTTENENTVEARATPDTTHQKMEGLYSFRLGECLGDVLSKGAMPQAYIVQDSAGNDQIMVSRVDDYCEVEATLAYRLSGDTLTVSYDEIFMATNCVCYSDHWFGLPAEYKGVKYFRFEGVTYEIVDSKEEGAL